MEELPDLFFFASDEKAVKLFSLNGLKDVKKMEKLRDRMISGLLMIEGTKLNGASIDSVKRLCNNINITFNGIEADTLLRHLDEKGIEVSTGSACHSFKLEPSHVIKAIGATTESALGTIRLSISKYTTQEEIDNTIYYTKKIVEILRSLKLKNKIKNGKLKN